MGIDYCSNQEKSYIVGLFTSTARDVDIKPLYTYLCPVIIFICFFSVIFNAILMGISRQSKVVNKSPILLLSLNLAVTDLIASLMNGLGILFNSYLPEVHDIKTGECWMLIFEVIRCAALVASALHLLALAIVHYRGIVNPLHYRYILLTAFALPLVVMVVIYLRIFIIISRHQKNRRQNHIERGSTLTRGVLSASGPVGSAAVMNLPQLMSNSASANNAATMDSMRGGYPSARLAGDKGAEGRVCSACASRETSQRSKAEVPSEGELAAGNRLGRQESGQAKEEESRSPISRSTRSATECRNNAGANIKFCLAQKRPISNSSGSIQVSQNRLVKSTREQRDQTTTNGTIPNNRSSSSSNNNNNNNNNNIDYDHRGKLSRQAKCEVGGCNDDRAGVKGESLLVDVDGSAIPDGLEHEPKLVTKLVNNEQVCDQSNNNDTNCNSGLNSESARLEGADTCGDKVNDGLTRGLTASAEGRQSSMTEFIFPPMDGAEGGSEAAKLADKPDDCCPSSSCIGGPMVAAGGSSSRCQSDGDPSSELLGCGNLLRLEPATSATVSEARRGDSCKSKSARVALRAQFSLGAQLLAPPISSSSRPTTRLQRLRMPNKPSLKQSKQQQRFTFTQRGPLNGPELESTKGGSSKSTWECSECDNKLRQLSVRLAPTCSALAGDTGDDSESSLAVLVKTNNKSPKEALVTMSVTNQSSHRGSSISSSPIHNTPSVSLNKKRPHLNRSLTAGAFKDTPKKQQQQQRQQRDSIGSDGRRRNELDHNSDSLSKVVSKNNNRTLTNTGSVASGSYYEPQRRHIHASAVPQTNTKALVTTLLILGTYFISYMPAILFQVLTCIDNCPYPLYIIPFSRRVLLGSITTLLVIAKSIIDPLIYSYRMSEVQVAINHYLSKRRSKSSMATSVLQASQRCPPAGGTSIYNNHMSNNNIGYLKQSAGSNQRVGAGRPSLGSLRILKQHSSASDYHGRLVAAAPTGIPLSERESPSRQKMARRLQSFDKYDYRCPDAADAAENVALSERHTSGDTPTTTSSEPASSSSSPASTSIESQLNKEARCDPTRTGERQKAADKDKDETTLLMA